MGRKISRRKISIDIERFSEIIDIALEVGEKLRGREAYVEFEDDGLLFPDPESEGTIFVPFDKRRKIRRSS